MLKLKSHAVFIAIFLGLFVPMQAMALDLAVQPILPKKELQKSFKPLADYLTKKTGHKIKFKAYSNFLRYWDDMRANKFDLVLDAAHLVDYRAQKHGHEVLAKVQDKVSFSLVTTEEGSVLEAEELIAKRISCLAPPSRGNLQIDKFFTNPIRQPFKTETRSFKEAIKLLQKGKVHASIVPTPMVKAFPGLYVVETTDLWPHMGFSASANVPANVKADLKKALLGMKDDKAAAAALKASGITGFEDGGNNDYQGFMRILIDTGYVN